LCWHVTHKLLKHPIQLLKGSVMKNLAKNEEINIQVCVIEGGKNR